MSVRRVGRIQKLAKDIREDYSGTTIHLLCVLKGGSAYFQDLITALRRFHDYSDHVREPLPSATGSESISHPLRIASACRGPCVRRSFSYTPACRTNLAHRCEAINSGRRRLRIHREATTGLARCRYRARVAQRRYSTLLSSRVVHCLITATRAPAADLVSLLGVGRACLTFVPCVFPRLPRPPARPPALPFSSARRWHDDTRTCEKLSKHYGNLGRPGCSAWLSANRRTFHSPTTSLRLVADREKQGGHRLA